jgi:crotonobetainyl-CoA:carnitine CoA-transferase CaiB-like acyl-CoA transferase
MAGALEGIRVVEFANYVSGPYAGMLLGDLGAEVIKVESPDGGDPFRGWGRVEYSPTFGSVNRNKKSVVLDLKSAQGVAAARALVRTADVLIENFRIGTMERLGLGYDAAARDNPRLVWCSITGFGTSGPYALRPGYDTVGQALSGLLSLLTDLDRPRPMGISQRFSY